MRRFLVFSDLHLNAWKYGACSTYQYTNNRLHSQIDFLYYLYEYADEREIDTILFAGDFFHTSGHVKAEVLQGGYTALRNAYHRYGVKLISIVGNHDQADKAGKIITTDFLRDFGAFATPNKGTLCADLLPIYGINYTESEDGLKQVLDYISRNPPGILLLHQGVSGVEVNTKGFTINEILTPDMIPDNIIHTYAGHYHSFKRINDKLTIPGAPMQFNWGDEGEDRGFLDVEIIGDEFHTKFVSSGRSEFKKIEFNPDLHQDDYPSFVFDNHPRAAYIKVTNVPTAGIIGDQIKNAFMRCGAQAVEIEYADTTAIVKDAEHFESFDSLFEEYVSSNDITGQRLEIGKSIIAGNFVPGGLDETSDTSM